MTSQQLSRIFLNGGCLSLDTMRAYQQGKLPRKEAHGVEEHLLACDLCSAALEGLDVKKFTEIDRVSSRVQKRLAVYMNTPPRIPFFRRYGIQIGFGAVLLIAGSVTLWLMNQSDNTMAKSAKTPVQQTAQVTPTLAANSSSAGVQPTVSSETVEPISSAGSAASTPVSSDASTSAEKKIADASTSTGSNPSETVKTSGSSAEVVTSTTSTTTSDNTKNVANEPFELEYAKIYSRDTYDRDATASTTTSDGQIKHTSKHTGKFKLEEMPNFPGGLDAFDGYFRKNYKPQVVADRSKMKMTSTSVSFVVDASSGKVSEVMLSRSISKEIDTEIVRVLQSMPNWDKGTKRGEIIVNAGIKVY